MRWIVHALQIVSSQLNSDIVDLASNQHAFAAITSKGRVIAWPLSDNRGLGAGGDMRYARSAADTWLEEDLRNRGYDPFQGNGVVTASQATL